MVVGFIPSNKIPQTTRVTFEAIIDTWNFSIYIHITFETYHRKWGVELLISEITGSILAPSVLFITSHLSFKYCDIYYTNTILNGIIGIYEPHKTSLYDGKSVRSWCDGSSDWCFMVDLLSYFSFQPVLHDWCNKGHGMCYPVCGMMHIRVAHLAAAGFLSLSEWFFTICLTPYNHK